MAARTSPPAERSTEDARRLVVLALIAALVWLLGVGSVAALVLSLRARRALTVSDESRIWHDLWKVAFVLAVLGLLLAAVVILNHIALTSEPESERL